MPRELLTWVVSSGTSVPICLGSTDVDPQHTAVKTPLADLYHMTEFDMPAAVCQSAEGCAIHNRWPISVFGSKQGICSPSTRFFRSWLAMSTTNAIRVYSRRRVVNAFAHRFDVQLTLAQRVCAISRFCQKLSVDAVPCVWKIIMNRWIADQIWVPDHKITWFTNEM